MLYMLQRDEEMTEELSFSTMLWGLSCQISWGEREWRGGGKSLQDLLKEHVIEKKI